jgi:hypothetical protein
LVGASTPEVRAASKPRHAHRARAPASAQRVCVRVRAGRLTGSHNIHPASSQAHTGRCAALHTSLVCAGLCVQQHHRARRSTRVPVWVAAAGGTVRNCTWHWLRNTPHPHTHTPHHTTHHTTTHTQTRTTRHTPHATRHTPGSSPFHSALGPSSRAIVMHVPSRPLRACTSVVVVMVVREARQPRHTRPAAAGRAACSAASNALRCSTTLLAPPQGCGPPGPLQCTCVRVRVHSALLLSHLYLPPPPCSCSLTLAVSRGSVRACRCVSDRQRTRCAHQQHTPLPTGCQVSECEHSSSSSSVDHARPHLCCAC